MPRQLNSILVLVCCFLPGCMSGPSLGLAARKPSSDVDIQQQQTSDFDLNDTTGHQQLPTDIDYASLRQGIVKTPLGSHVRVSDQHHSYTGTLLERGADRVVLMNSICKEAVPGPDGQMQCKTSHTPIQSFATSSVTGFTTFSPPPAGFVAPDINEDGSSVTVADIVYRDGHHERRDKPFELVSSKCVWVSRGERQPKPTAEE
jgi:hypothetical protein